MVTLKPVTPVGILARELRKVLADLGVGKPVEVNSLERLNRCLDLAAGLDPYLEKHTTPEHESLTRLVDETHRADWTDKEDSNFVKGLEVEMLSGHVEGQFLKMLVAIAGASSILEIGVFSGYSALAMAQALPDHGRLVACEIDNRAASFARNQFIQAGCINKLDLRIGPALESLSKLAATKIKFDMVFVDADKASYRNYVKFLLDSKLIDVGGFFVLDNTLLQGETYSDVKNRSVSGEAIAKFNEYLSAEKRVEQVILPLRDGVTIARRIY